MVHVLAKNKKRNNKTKNNIMGILQGAGTGAAIGSVIPGIGTAAGAIAGGIIGLGQSIGGWISGENKEKKQREHEKEMMGLQYQYLRCNSRDAFLDICKTFVSYSYRNNDGEFPFPVDDIKCITNRFYCVNTVTVRIFGCHNFLLFRVYQFFVDFFHHFCKKNS